MFTTFKPTYVCPNPAQWKNTTPLNDMPRTMININSQIISKQEEEYQARVI